MFSKPSVSDASFVKGGMKAWKHVHQRIEEHEKKQIPYRPFRGIFPEGKESRYSKLTCRETNVSPQRAGQKKKDK